VSGSAALETRPGAEFRQRRHRARTLDEAAGFGSGPSWLKRPENRLRSGLGLECGSVTGQFPDRVCRSSPGGMTRRRKTTVSIGRSARNSPILSKRRHGYTSVRVGERCHWITALRASKFCPKKTPRFPPRSRPPNTIRPNRERGRSMAGPKDPENRGHLGGHAFCGCFTNGGCGPWRGVDLKAFSRPAGEGFVSRPR